MRAILQRSGRTVREVSDNQLFAGSLDGPANRVSTARTGEHKANLKLTALNLLA